MSDQATYPEAGRQAYEPDRAHATGRQWHFYSAHEDDTTVRREAMRAVATDFEKPGLHKVDLQARWGELLALIAEAEGGQLNYPEDWKPVALDPRLWELRYAWKREGARRPGHVLRGYFVEPQQRPDKTVLLSVHPKKRRYDESDVGVKEDQNSHIETASRRYDSGRATEWGLDWSPRIRPDDWV